MNRADALKKATTALIEKFEGSDINYYSPTDLALIVLALRFGCGAPIVDEIAQ